MGYLYRLKEISTNLLENQDFIELARKISILELYSLMILNRSFYMTLSPSRSVRCETKNHPFSRVVMISTLIVWLPVLIVAPVPRTGQAPCLLY